MKTLIVTTALVASLISLGYSQERTDRPHKEGSRSERPGERSQVRTPEERAQRSTDVLEKKLSLTAEQKAKVYALNLERAQKMDKTMKSEREFRKAQMENHKSLMDESEKNLNKILTNEQQKSYDEMKKQTQERMKDRHHRGHRTKMK